MDSWRVAVLGDGGVGKTALAVQFTLNCFVGKPNQLPCTFYCNLMASTLPPILWYREDAYRKQLIVDNKMCFVEVIDTAGQEEYATLRDQWVREGQGFILVYSIASRSTFERLDVFRQSMLKVKRQKPIFMLVGNKCDKTYEREVSREEGIALARTFGCEFMETSARTAYNVELLFTNLVRALRQTKRLESGGSGGKQSDKQPKDGGSKKPKCVVM
ncbi:small GTPase superfamily [Suillus fuscotomentosus]|uniref:Small GTPase superfamily n=1 Tax=Suillus fuscotomentosus TaxID=1912939 RepID=A0AAD4HRH9_9AGAM|nr:small GTPase superfamily [Suillus fuscotomentosus]KAG1904874.1 small GTPase superfamily [Suillus fuscotomentosus]